jgi:hypothetical protein
MLIQEGYQAFDYRFIAQKRIVMDFSSGVSCKLEFAADNLILRNIIAVRASL